MLQFSATFSFQTKHLILYKSDAADAKFHKMKLDNEALSPAGNARFRPGCNGCDTNPESFRGSFRPTTSMSQHGFEQETTEEAEPKN
jgi:hypothetical protein